MRINRTISFVVPIAWVAILVAGGAGARRHLHRNLGVALHLRRVHR